MATKYREKDEGTEYTEVTGADTGGTVGVGKKVRLSYEDTLSTEQLILEIEKLRDYVAKEGA